MKKLATAIVFATIGHAALAADPLVIGQTADFSSVAGAQMKSFNAGAQAYFDEVNRKGGIGGRKIKLVTVDDAFSADAARQNAQKLIADKEVVMLFGPRGTDPSEAVVAEAEKAGIAVVAPITGADTVRVSPVVFPVRGSYRAEINEMLKHIAVYSSKVVLLVQDDKFGNPLHDYIQAQVKAAYPTVSIAGVVKFDRKDVDMKEEAAKVLALGQPSVIALCNPTSCGSFMKNIAEQADAARKPRPVVYQTSISDMFAQYDKIGGKIVAGSPYSQVLPNPRNTTIPVSHDYMALMQKTGGPVDYRAFEGYVSARVAVQGLSRAKTLDRAGVRTSMENLGHVDLGGFSVSYAPNQKGSTFAELVSVSATGRIVR